MLSQIEMANGEVGGQILQDDATQSDNCPRIGKFEQSDPVHAKCDQPKFGFDDMIGIEFGRCQSSSMDHIRLGVDIDFGSVEITIEDQPYELSLSSIIIQLEKENAEVEPGSKYHHVLRPGKIDSTASAVERTSGGYNIDVGGDVSAQTPKAGIKGKFSKSSKREAETKLAIEFEIALVEPSGQDRWKAGGAEGNPLSPTKDLRGPIIQSFRGDQMTPLCVLKANNPSKAVVARVRVQASATDFRLRPKQQAFVGVPRSAHGSIRDGLKSDQNSFHKRAESADLSLKHRVAALALVQVPKKRTTDPMLDLAERIVAIEPESPPEPGSAL
jgi:hypothetical protein